MRTGSFFNRVAEAPILNTIRNTTGHSRVELFHNTFFALGQCIRGLSEQYPNKMKIGVVKASSPYLEITRNWASKLGLKISDIQMNKYGNFNSVIDQLDKDAKSNLAIVLGEDDPLLGTLFSIEEILKHCIENKVFVISISHNNYIQNNLFSSLSNDRWIRILDVDSSMVVGLIGEKVKMQSQLPGSADFSHVNFDFVVNRLKLIDENKNSVLKFENGKDHGAKVFFDSNMENRLFDRACIYWDDLDSSAILDLLRERKPEVFSKYSDLIESSSFCRWKGKGELQWLMDQGISSDTIQGLLIIDQKILNDEMAATLSNVKQELLLLQSS